MNPELLYNPAYKTIILSDEVEIIRLRQSKVDETINNKLQVEEHSLLVGSREPEGTRILLSGGSVAVGLNTQAEAENSIAIGYNAEVIGDESIKKGGIAIGHNARADGKEAIAIGKNTQVHNNRIGIGRSQVSIKLGALVIQLDVQNSAVELDLMAPVTDTEDGPDPDETLTSVKTLRLGNNRITFDDENDEVIFTNSSGKYAILELKN
jgi:hypothetical protein